MQNSKSVKCKKCGWIHFSVSLEYCKAWEKDWEVFWATLEERGRDAYGCLSGPPKIEDTYLTCHCCGGSYKDFTEATEEDRDKVYGSTINPILEREKNETV